jgi:heptosyltransferase-2
MEILIIKVGALGDVVRTSFIAQALKDKYQKNNPFITWITGEKAKPLFLNNPYVDKIITKKEDLTNKKWDLIINLEEDEDNCRFISSLDKKELIGFYIEDGKILPTPSTKEWFDMSILGKKPENDILKKKNKKTHRQIISEIVGINDWQKYEPFLRLTEEQRKICSDFMRRHNLSRKDLIIGINTGSADRWPKQLSIEKTAGLIDILTKEFKAKILLFGGPNEIERNKQIISLAKSHIIDTGCGNDLVEFPSLISACSVFVTTDSLGLHISLALKRKTICLVGPTSPSEIDLYGLGEKVIAKSDCVCCYKKDCKSMEKIEVKDITNSLARLLKQKVVFLITAFKEPNIGKAIESALKQNTSHKFEIIVSAPDKKTLDVAKKYAAKNKNLKVIKDPGKGKSFALNLIFSKIDSDILILTDGDVFASPESVEEIVNLFNDPEIGCVTGRPIPVENRKDKYGYWANFLFDAAHRIRKESADRDEFIECSGYLFAFRNKIIKEIPLDVAEDSVIPYFFWEKGYKIGYAEKAGVYVKNVDNWKDWLKQKIRTSKAHETLDKYVNTQHTKRVKTFGNEAGKGMKMLFEYPKNAKEFIWTLELASARFWMWGKVFWDTRVKNKNYGDAWERSESAR